MCPGFKWWSLTHACSPVHLSANIDCKHRLRYCTVSSTWWVYMCTCNSNIKCCESDPVRCWTYSMHDGFECDQACYYLATVTLTKLVYMWLCVWGTHNTGKGKGCSAIMVVTLPTGFYCMKSICACLIVCCCHCLLQNGGPTRCVHYSCVNFLSWVTKVLESINVLYGLFTQMSQGTGMMK